MLLACVEAMSQDPSFTQFFQKSSYVNPAYTGIYGGKEIHTIAHHREQWMNAPLKFTTSLLSADWRVCQKNLGIGVIVLQNIEGDGLLTSTDFSIPLAAHIPISRELAFSSAIQTTFASRTINWESLIFSDQLDPILGNIYSSTASKPNDSYYRVYPSAGIVITKKWTQQSKRHDYINFGIAAHHLPVGQNNESFYAQYENSQYPTKYTIHGNWFAKVTPYKRFNTGGFIGDFFDYTNIYCKLENQGSLKKQKESFTTISAGAGFSMKKLIMFGIGYRQGFRKNKNQIGDDFERNLMSESIIFNTIFNINPKNLPYKLYITYSFDMNISDLGYQFSGPTHEVSLNMYIGSISCRPKRKRGRAHLWSHVFNPGKQGRYYNRELCDPFPKISDWDGY